MTGPRVVVVGAGVVGAALAEELSTRGVTDVTVLDQGPLYATGGSSSHAPGLVFQCNGSKTLTEMARYTVEKFNSLQLDGQPCFLPVGGLEVALTEERLAELHRRHGWLTSWGVQSRVVSPDECAKLHSMLDPDLLLGGLHTPTDGLAVSVRAVTAQARAAERRGVRFLPYHEVLDVKTKAGRVVGVKTNRGDFLADIVVCCAGIWGPKVARMTGTPLPLTPLAHQLAWTTSVPELEGQTEDATRPIIRHQGADLYFRERRDTLGIGYYGHRPLPVTADEILAYDEAEVMPSVLEFTPDDFAPAWDESQRLFPGLAETGIAEGMNGLFSFTTDNMPLLGESSQVRGMFFAEAVWVTHSAGVGRAMAELLVDGVSSYDLHDCDINRFEQHHLAPDYVTARGCQNYIEVYDVIHPLQPMEDPRPLRTTPFHPRQAELGAVFLEANGWERAHWHEANASLLDGRDIPIPGEWAARYWSPIVGAEAQVTRERVALYDMSALKRLEVTGRGALDFLTRLTTQKMDKSVGAVTYCLLLDERGGIRSDITVARLGEDRFQLGVNGNLDLDWLTRRLPDDGSVVVRDLTPGTCCIGVWGPKARDLVAPLTRDDFSAAGFKYFRAKETYLGMVPVTAMRLSYVGELGWELYTTADMALKLWDTLWDAGQDHGVIAAGRGAFNSLRLEKGYRSFGADMTHEHDPYQAGLGFAVRMDKGDFTGRAALASKYGAGGAGQDAGGGVQPSQRLCALVIDDPGDGAARVVTGKEPVYDGDACVGYVTSAAYGHTIGASIAYAWLPAELSEVGTSVHIGYFDQRISARVAAEPLFDPTMTRLRS
ncbi:MAG: GcvT family protein [Micromonosporaceae bacterium]